MDGAISEPAYLLTHTRNCCTFVSMKLFNLALFALITNLASASIVTKTVEYDHAGTKFKGFLAYDDKAASGAKQPGVLIVHEWWGLNDYTKSRAMQLAEMGYVAFAVDMFGNGENTIDAKRAAEMAGGVHGPLMAERAQAGLDQLIKTGLVDESKIAAIGFCFGGSTCQALAFSGAPLAGIVSFHGGLIQPSPEEVKKVKAKFLMLNGAIDPMVKSEDIITFLKALDKGPVDYQFVDYSGALHAFSNPEATQLAQANGLSNAVGYNEKVAIRAWAQMKLFFEEIFHSK